MGFRFQRRLNLGRGVGVNLGKTGASASYRNKAGSFGTSGVSLRTGIPGLSFRQSFGKSGGIGYIAVAFGFAALLAFNAVWLLGAALFRIAEWSWLTLHDYIDYRRSQRNRSLP